jgi:hypothetical protein
VSIIGRRPETIQENFWSNMLHVLCVEKKGQL